MKYQYKQELIQKALNKAKNQYDRVKHKKFKARDELALSLGRRGKSVNHTFTPLS